MKTIYMLTTLQYMIASKIKTEDEINQMLEGFQPVGINGLQYFVK